MPNDFDSLVEQITDRVRARLQQEAVPPNAEVRGAWNDLAALRMAMDCGAERFGTVAGTNASSVSGDIARRIDHTLLKPTSMRKDIERVCAEAREYGFASVCVNTTWIGLTAQLLKGSNVMPICVIGFPLGAASTNAKIAETRDGVRAGAAEIDMVINIGALKGGEHDRVLEDIRAVVNAADGRPVKVILETSMLNREEKIAGCALSRAAGAAFVKTSTGFGGGGATVEDVRLMRQIVGPEMGVKASGGVRSAQDAEDLIAAGADRLGASASVAVVTGGRGTGSY